MSNIKIEVNQILNDFYRFWETADLSLLEKSVSKDVIDHDADPRNEGTHYEGIIQLANAVSGLAEMHHDLTQIHDLGDDTYMVRWEATAIHSGNLFGVPATGRKVFFNGHDIVKIKDGKIVEEWHIEQLLQLMGQIQ